MHRLRSRTVRASTVAVCLGLAFGTEVVLVTPRRELALASGLIPEIRV